MEQIDSIKQLIIEVELLKQENKFDEALKILETSVIKYSNDYRILEEICDIYIYQMILDKAEKAIDFALELNPESATGNYLKGFILLATDRVDKSVDYLEKSNSLLGNNAEVLRNLGFAYTVVGKEAQGISILKRALALNPGDELITEDLAMALIGSGEVLEGNVLLRKIGKHSNA